MFKYKKQSGIGLLELMLAMAIIAILIVMSITYFQSSKNKTLITAGIEELQGIIGVISGLTDPKASAGGTDGGSLTKTVALSGSIPKEYVLSGGTGLTSPWGGSSSYTVTYKTKLTNGGVEGISISGTALPTYACEALKNQFILGQNNIVYSNCSANTLTIEVSVARDQDIVPHDVTPEEPAE